MSTESESSEFIGWYAGYHEHDAKIAGLEARNAKLVAALEAAQRFVEYP